MSQDKVEDGVKELDGTESEEGEEAETKDVRKKKRKPEAEEKEDSAAGGDWDLPSIFRTLRGSDRG